MTAVRTARGEVVVALGLATGVDETDASGVAVDDLPASQVDGVVGGQLGVHAWIGLAELDGVVAAVVHGLLLLDDVGLDRDAEVIALAGQVRAELVVDAVLDEGVVAQVAPQHGEEAQAVRLGEGRADLFDLVDGAFGAEVDGRAHADRAEVGRLANRREELLVVASWGSAGGRCD